MAKYSFGGILFIFFTICFFSLSAQPLRVVQDHYLNYYLVETGRYLLQDNLYQWGSEFREGVAIVEKNRKYGAIDSTGKEIIPLKYDKLGAFSQEQAVFVQEHLQGVVTIEGTEVIPAKCDYIGQISGGKRAIMIDGKWGCVNLMGSIVVPLNYQYVGDFQEGRAMFLSEGKWGFLNQAGKVAIKPEYEWVANMHEGKIAVMQKGQYGYIDSLGKELIPLQYELAWDFSEELAAVKIGSNASIGFVNAKAKMIIPAKYEDFFNFSEKVAAVKLAATHKWGFLRKDGSQLTDFVFDDAKQMKNGRAAVKKKGKWGYIDAEGKEVIPYQYVEAFDFGQEYAIIGMGEATDVESVYKPALEKSKANAGLQMQKKIPRKFGYINKMGQMIIPAEYQDIRPISPKYVWVQQGFSGGKYCNLMDKTSIQSETLPQEELAIEKAFWEEQIQSVFLIKDKNGKLLTEKRFIVDKVFAKEACFINENGRIYNASGYEMFKQSYQRVKPLDERIFEILDNDRQLIQVDVNEKQVNTEAFRIIRQMGKGFYIAAYESPDNEGYLIVDEKGRQVGDMGFQAIELIDTALFRCKKQDKWGVYNGNGFMLIPCKYDEIVGYQNEMAVVLRDSSRGYASKDNFFGVATLKEMPQNRLALFSENFAPFYKNGKYGFINKNNKVAIPCEYDMVWGFHNGLAKVKKDKKVGYINPKNEVIIPLEYDELELFSEGLALAKKGLKFGFIDAKNAIVVPFIYQDAFSFQDSLAIVQSGVNNKWGCIDTKGEVQVLFNYEEISQFSEGHAKVSLNGGEGIIDKKNVLIKDCIFDKVGKIENGLVIVIYKGRYGLIDMNGQFKISPEYAQITRLKGDVFLCQSISLSGFYTQAHQLILPIQYESDKNILKEQYCALSKYSNNLLFDKYGRLMKEAGQGFSALNDKFFTEGKAKKIIYDRKANLLIPAIYKNIQAIPLQDDMFLVENDSSVYGIINTENKTLLPIVYQAIKPIGNGLFIVKINALYALVDENNEMMIPPIYQDIDPISAKNDIFIVRLNNKVGVIDANNKTIIPLQEAHIYKPYGDYKEYLLLRDKEEHETIYTFKGKKLELPAFTEVYISDNEEIILLKNNELSGLYTLNGIEIYPMNTDEIFISSLNDAFIPIKKNNQWGMIDRNGHIMALFKYDYLKYISTKGKIRFIFEQGNKTGIMDEEWEAIYEDTAEILYDKTLELFYTGQGKNKKYIGIDGKEVKK